MMEISLVVLLILAVFVAGLLLASASEATSRRAADGVHAEGTICRRHGVQRFTAI
jgi:hypothetical protein